MAKMKGPERVRAALETASLDCEVLTLPDSTRTAAEAAAAVGCSVGEIAKSLVFRAGERAIVAIMSGDHRLDTGKLGAALGQKVVRADADFVRAATGFSIGGVPPLGHTDTGPRAHGRRPLPLRADLGCGGEPVQRVRDRARAAPRCERRGGHRSQGGLKG